MVELQLMHNILCMAAKDWIRIIERMFKRVRHQQISHLDPREPCARRCALVVELRPVGAMGEKAVKCEQKVMNYVWLQSLGPNIST